MDIDQLNSLIRDESKGCTQKLKDKIRALNMKHISRPENAEPLTQITNKFSEQSGMINRIRFVFKRSGVFVHKGVGRGTKASQVGTTKRVAKEWFNPIVEEFADELVEKVADANVEIIFDKLKIK